MKLKPTQYLQFAMIIIDLIAAVVCDTQGLQKAVYWIAAAVLNITVTF